MYSTMNYSCLHTEKPLFISELPGNDFGISDEGVVYYLKAHIIDYESNYFLNEYKKQYGITYFEDEQNIRILARRRLNRIRKYTSSSPRLLEIGCAAGFFLDEAREEGYSVVGLDVSDYALNHAKEILNLEVKQKSFSDFDLCNKFDVIASFYSIEHFSDQKKTFQNISSLLKPGGIFFFALPSTNGPLYKTDQINWQETHPVDHFADYSPSSLKKIFPMYNMDLVDIWPAAYHPERICGFSVWKWNSLLYRLYADSFCFGDTMEGVAKKGL